MLLGFFAYLGIAGTVIPGKVVPGVILSDGTRLHYRCNGVPSLTQFIFPTLHFTHCHFCALMGVLMFWMRFFLVGWFWDFRFVDPYFAGCATGHRGSDEFHFSHCMYTLVMHYSLLPLFLRIVSRVWLVELDLEMENILHGCVAVELLRTLL